MEVLFFVKENGDWICFMLVYDGEFLYVVGMWEFFVCLNVINGEIVWKFDFVDVFGMGLFLFGCVCLLFVLGDYLFI